jgi:hypothetical protein
VPGGLLVRPNDLTQNLNITFWGVGTSSSLSGRGASPLTGVRGGEDTSPLTFGVPSFTVTSEGTTPLQVLDEVSSSLGTARRGAGL